MLLDVPEDDIFGNCKTLSDALETLDLLLADVQAKVIRETVEVAQQDGSDPSLVIAIQASGFAYARAELMRAVTESGRWPVESVH